MGERETERQIKRVRKWEIEVKVEWGMIARSDYVFTRSEQNGRENSLDGSAVPATAVRLFELCMDTACLQRVLFTVCT